VNLNLRASLLKVHRNEVILSSNAQDSVNVSRTSISLQLNAVLLKLVSSQVAKPVV